MTLLEDIVEEASRQERNIADFEDLRFAEIYVDDNTPVRKTRKIINQQKETK
jgi:hypothetical protein